MSRFAPFYSDFYRKFVTRAASSSVEFLFSKIIRQIGSEVVFVIVGRARVGLRAFDWKVVSLVKTTALIVYQWPLRRAAARCCPTHPSTDDTPGYDNISMLVVYCQNKILLYS